MFSSVIFVFKVVIYYLVGFFVFIRRNLSWCNLRTWNFYIWHNIYYSFILLIKSRIFNISIDSSSLNILSPLLSHLPQIIERTNDLVIVIDLMYEKVFKISTLVLLLQQVFSFIDYIIRHVLNKFINTFLYL